MAYERLDTKYKDGQIWDGKAVTRIDDAIEEIINSMSVTEIEALPFNEAGVKTVTDIYMVYESNTCKLITNQYTANYSVVAYPISANVNYRVTVIREFPETRACLAMYTDNLDNIVSNGTTGLTRISTSGKLGDSWDVSFNSDGYIILGALKGRFYTKIEVLQSNAEFVSLNKTMANLSKIEKALESTNSSQKSYKGESELYLDNVYMIYVNNNKNCKLNQDQYSFRYAANAYPVSAGAKYIIKIVKSSPEARTCPAAFTDNLAYVMPNSYENITSLCASGYAVGDEYTYTFDKDGYILLSTLKSSGPYAEIYEYEYELINVGEELNTIKASMKGAGNDAFICCPDNWYAVVGQEFVIYYDGIVKGMDAGLDSPFGIYTDIRCPTLGGTKGFARRQDRLWCIPAGKLTSSQVGTHSVYITAMTQSGTIIDTKTVTLHVTEAKNPTSTSYICCIGDSLTNNGPIVSTCENHFKALDGIPPTFVGSRYSYNAYHEGYPGWTFGSFVRDSGTSYHIFDVPADSVCSVGDVYALESVNYTIQDIRVEGLDGLYRLRCTASSTTTVASSGTLTYVSGNSNSQASITYSAYEKESGNPFWNSTTSALDIAKYRSNKGMGDSKFDVVFILLGTNDCISFEEKSDSSIAAIVANAKTLVNAIQTDAGSYPTKIVVNLTPPDANTTSSWQVYSDGTGSRKIAYWKNLWKLRVALYNEFSTGYTNVYLGSAGQQVDRYYGFPYTTIKSASRIQVDEIYHTNSVHPNTEGYKQIGDAYYLIAQNMLNM